MTMWQSNLQYILLYDQFSPLRKVLEYLVPKLIGHLSKIEVQYYSYLNQIRLRFVFNRLWGNIGANNTISCQSPFVRDPFEIDHNLLRSIFRKISRKEERKLDFVLGTL